MSQVNSKGTWTVSSRFVGVYGPAEVTAESHFQLPEGGGKILTEEVTRELSLEGCAHQVNKRRHARPRRQHRPRPRIECVPALTQGHVASYGFLKYCQLYPPGDTAQHDGPREVLGISIPHPSGPSLWLLPLGSIGACILLCLVWPRNKYQI